MDKNVSKIFDVFLYLHIVITNFPIIKNIDNLIYKISRKKSTLYILILKILILTKKMRRSSNLNIIVIGGCPRSGTTLVRALIGMHPKIACPQRECYFLNNFKNQTVLKETFDFSLEKIKNLKDEYKEYMSYVENVLRFYKKKEGKEFVAVKVPIYVTILDRLFHHFPNIKFIHVIRDGRDTVCSLRRFPKRKIVNGEIIPIKIKNPFDWCIRLWVSCINISRMWKDSDRFLEVKYEDVVNDTSNTMKKIFKFLNLEMSDEDQLLSFYKYEKDEKHPQNIEISKPMYKKSIGRWKGDMGDQDKKMFKHMAGELLVELDYEKDLDWQ